MKITEAFADVLDGLKNSPGLLGVLLINVIMISAAVYFLVKFGEANTARMELILRACLPKVGDLTWLTTAL